MVQQLEQNAQQSVAALKTAKEEDLTQKWMLKKGDHVIFEMPKSAVIRSMALNHTYHHRAQLGVYLRLLDVPVSGIYGPSADDMA